MEKISAPCLFTKGCLRKGAFRDTSMALLTFLVRSSGGFDTKKVDEWSLSFQFIRRPNIVFNNSWAPLGKLSLKPSKWDDIGIKRQWCSSKPRRGLLGMVKLEFRSCAMQQHANGGQLPKAILCLDVWSLQCEGPGHGLELLDGGTSSAIFGHNKLRWWAT